MKTAVRRYACAVCGRKLSPERAIYSRHTGQRYCRLGEGCGKGKR